MGTKSKEVLNSLAKTAANSYLNKKTPMNETIKKVASAEGLEPHQVEYVASEANKMVWASHYKMDKKAAYDFPLANPNEIIDDLQIKPIVKISEASMDYMLPPSEMKKMSSPDKSISGVFESEYTKGTDRRELKQTLQHRYEKLAQAKEDTQMEMITIQRGLENLERRFVKEARQLIMETPFLDRPQAMDKIAEFVRSAGKTEVGLDLMKKLASKIVKDGLIKQADLKAPEQYISETLPARIINGNHSLYITIDTIVKQKEMHANLHNSFIICDDTLPQLKEKIRGL